MKTRINTIASFGQGDKVHFISICEDDKLGWNRKYAIGCGVESRWNVHGIQSHEDLTLDDVNCAKCLKRIEWLKTKVEDEAGHALRFALNKLFDLEE